jgi:hypothetical protein
VEIKPRRRTDESLDENRTHCHRVTDKPPCHDTAAIVTRGCRPKTPRRRPRSLLAPTHAPQPTWSADRRR